MAHVGKAARIAAGMGARVIVTEIDPINACTGWRASSNHCRDTLGRVTFMSPPPAKRGHHHAGPHEEMKEPGDVCNIATSNNEIRWTG